MLRVLTFAAVLLGGLFVSSASLAAGQEPTPTYPTLRGTVSTIVDRTIVDRVIVHEERAPVTNGRVMIPELDVEEPLAADGTFNFGIIPLPKDPMLVSVDIRAEGFRPLTWANYLVLTATGGLIFTPDIERGSKPWVLNSCVHLNSIPERKLSAAQHRQWLLCSELPSMGLPETGGGGPVAESGSPVASGLLALVGAALLCAGTVFRRMDKTG